jgi:hypothetical protein
VGKPATKKKSVSKAAPKKKSAAKRPPSESKTASRVGAVAPLAPAAPALLDESITAADRFGERAVKMGFCSREEVNLAVDAQEDCRRSGRPHTLIGLVLLELGSLSTDQLIKVLKTYEDGADPVE